MEEKRKILLIDDEPDFVEERELLCFFKLSGSATRTFIAFGAGFLCRAFCERHATITFRKINTVVTQPDQIRLYGNKTTTWEALTQNPR